MDFNLPGPEQLKECPYNRAHLVVAHRMPHHLIKCARSHTTAGTAACKFNPSHVVPAAKISEHEKTCADRLEVELLQMADRKVSTLRASSSNVSSVTSSNVNNDDDDWDLSEDKTYNPKVAVKQMNVVRHAQHLTPSERNQFRLDEEKRLNDLRAVMESESRHSNV